MQACCGMLDLQSGGVPCNWHEEGRLIVHKMTIPTCGCSTAIAAQDTAIICGSTLTFLRIHRASSRPRCMISSSRWGSVSDEKLTNADLRVPQQYASCEPFIFSDVKGLVVASCLPRSTAYQENPFLGHQCAFWWSLHRAVAIRGANASLHTEGSSGSS